MIPSPNLDDRTYQDIVKEAIRLIPHYCPEWTNHNPSDPGITLIELFAWMSEMIIYRLNKVPDKTYLTLLNLVGLSFLPPQSSRALVTFSPVKGYEGEVLIRRGTQISTKKSERSELLVFQTEKELLVKNIKLTSCYSMVEEKITNNLEKNSMNNGSEGFLLFSGENQIERNIYIGDPRISLLADKNIVNITFNGTTEIRSVRDELVNFLEWSYWNGKKWTSLETHRSMDGVKRKDNEIYFTGPLEIEETELNEKTGFFLRGALVENPERVQSFEMNEVLMNVTFAGEGLNPDICLSNSANMIFNTIDLGKDFTPYIEIPKYNDVFYIACDEIFSKEDSRITMKIFMSDEPKIDKPEANKDLLLKYEYWNGKFWSVLGESTINGAKGDTAEYEFIDTTNAFTRSGQVIFRRPGNLSSVDVNGHQHYWLRVRIGAGDFGTAGQYKKNEDDKWEWVYNQPVESPVFNRIRLFYTAEKKPPETLNVYNEYTYTDFSEINKKNNAQNREENPAKEPFMLLKIHKEKNAMAYFGFEGDFPHGDMGIYFKINEQRQVLPERGTLVSMKKIGIRIPERKRQISLRWEYWNGSEWTKLSVNDYTDSFHESGFIEFKVPAQLKEKEEFGKKCFWIRLVFESGSFEIPPRILKILLNSVYVKNHHTYENEVLGSSNGMPSQEFDIFHGPVLPGIELYVKEECVPPSNEKDLILEEEGEDALRIKEARDGNKEEVWIRYHEVENFYASKAISRHFCVDYINNKIIFGDGRRGVIPPRLKNNIKIAQYTTGGGVIGNVGSHTLTVLRENIPYIKDVINYYPAEGGADLEDLESLKSRATSVFKNLNRAVTAEDYEWLAMESSTSVARAKCLSRGSKKGEVVVVIVPRPESKHVDLKEKLIPSSELLKRIKAFLDVRKLIGTKLKVEAAAYKSITINLKLVFQKDISEVQILKQRVDGCIRRLLHPTMGGINGNGWPFGFSLVKNDIYNALEKVEGIYYIEEIEIIDDDLNIAVEKCVVDEDSLFYVENVNIIDRKSQY
ncbi:MAG: putative baseplate assembly protein [Spirochaetales bacterium]|nr:putative baseplate assembly protein [Spirochaetales bacterium]